jgi:hypothetical protein
VSKAEDAEIINEAIADPVPYMAGVPEVTVELIRGLYDPSDDVWHTDAEVRELTGEDEEYLASLENKKGLLYSEYMNALLSRAVIRIGTVELTAANGKKLVNQLMLGDRDLLYMAVVRATYGDTRLINVACTSCKVKNDVELLLDEDFPVTYPDFDIREGLKVETSRGMVTLRMPNGEDTVIAQKEADNDATLNTVMLSRCAVWPEGEAPSNPMKWARSLNIGDRKKLINALLDVEVGPKMGEVNTQCASCGEDMPILLDWVSLLLS